MTGPSLMHRQGFTRNVLCGVAVLAVAAAVEPLAAQDALVRRLIHDLVVLEQFRPPREGLPVTSQLALQERQALGLTPDQVERIASIRMELSRDIMRSLAGLLESSPEAAIALWTGDDVDRDVLRLELHRKADHDLDTTLRIIQQRVAVLALLSDQQRARYRETETRRYAAAGAAAIDRDPDLVETPWTGRGVPHPAMLALAYADTLALTAEQAAGLRLIESEVNTAIALRRASEFDRADSVLAVWTAATEQVDTAALRAGEHAAAERDLILAGVLLSTRDRAFALLDAGQQPLLRQLQRNAVEEAHRPQPRTYPCTAGSASGGFTRDRLHVNYSVSFAGDSADIEVVFVGRRDRRRANLPPPEKPVLPDAPQFLSGGTMGAWWVQYDRRSRTAWIYRQKVELGDQNLVFIDGIDDSREPPRVSGTLRISNRIFTGGCAAEPFTDLLYEQLRRVPEVQALLNR